MSKAEPSLSNTPEELVDDLDEAVVAEVVVAGVVGEPAALGLARGGEDRLAEANGNDRVATAVRDEDRHADLAERVEHVEAVLEEEVDRDPPVVMRGDVGEAREGRF